MSTSIFDADGGYESLSETEPDCPQSLSERQLEEAMKSHSGYGKEHADGAED